MFLPNTVLCYHRLAVIHITFPRNHENNIRPISLFDTRLGTIDYVDDNNYDDRNNDDEQYVS